MQPAPGALGPPAVGAQSPHASRFISNHVGLKKPKKILGLFCLEEGKGREVSWKGNVTEVCKVRSVTGKVAKPWLIMVSPDKPPGIAGERFRVHKRQWLCIPPAVKHRRSRVIPGLQK